jgi:hypothetical protein
MTLSPQEVRCPSSNSMMMMTGRKKRVRVRYEYKKGFSRVVIDYSTVSILILN